jgi:hypothetical protein
MNRTELGIKIKEFNDKHVWKIDQGMYYATIAIVAAVMIAGAGALVYSKRKTSPPNQLTPTQSTNTDDRTDTNEADQNEDAPEHNDV